MSRTFHPGRKIEMSVWLDDNGAGIDTGDLFAVFDQENADQLRVVAPMIRALYQVAETVDVPRSVELAG